MKLIGGHEVVEQHARAGSAFEWGGQRGPGDGQNEPARENRRGLASVMNPQKTQWLDEREKTCEQEQEARIDQKGSQIHRLRVRFRSIRGVA